MVEKKRDTGRTARPGTSKKGDSAKAKKVSAKIGRADSGERKGRSARRPATDDDEDEGEEAAPPPRGGMTAGKALLLCTPITMILLLAVGYKLAMMPDPQETKKEIVIDYAVVLNVANAKYQKAKTCYDEGSKAEGAAGLPKLKEARDLLQKEDKDPTTIKTIEEASAAGNKGELGAQQLIDWVRGKVEDPLVPTGKNEAVKNYEFETKITEINMLLGMIRKAIQERT